jgi:hypothetical protein
MLPFSYKKLSNMIRLLFSTLLILYLGTLSKPAKAGEVRVFEKNGIALNVNKAFGLKHNKIVISQYSKSNYLDNEQRFEVIPVFQDASLLRNLATNECFNSYLTTVGSIPNIWTCNTNDKDQWVKIRGNDIYSYTTGLQLNLGDSNNTVVKWKNPINVPVSGKTVTQVNYEWEYWIVARARKYQNSVIEPESGRIRPEVGHAWNALIKRKITKYSDNSVTYDNWKADTIFESNPPSANNGYKSLISLQTGDSINDTQAILDGNNSNFPRGYAVRKSRVSEGRATYIKNNINVAGCDGYVSKWYNAYSVQYGGNTCNCVDYATRSWKYYTAGWEDFRPKTAESALYYGVVGVLKPSLSVEQLDNSAFNLTPDALMKSLNFMTQRNGTEMLDNGKTW